ncbi:MAG: phage virion morphogenesis protein [Chloroflexaceae bacterium]|nr:phage virion morphogenesis protein [Chloroflexaceae bacterium]
MSVRLTIDVADMARVAAVVDRVAAADTEPLMTDIGAVLESSTRERIEETKTSPDGAAWPPNRAGTSTLLATGRHLRDSVAFIASADHVEVGAAWEFAHVHQFGATISAKNARLLSFMAGGQRVFAKQVTIPARPFVGLSDQDGRKVERLATDWLGRLLGGAP